ncbi:M15 family metallopeptidase [Macrococcus lamae]|uniref:D-alanyl-D-alanine carboxypeptidase family protein n=1 Tax=Macrococcus lamae TaxID=198484 RepID=A0A4R6BUX5_9STAP|nr:M15 family metallopeptidase [Macrococcus lamae]TDM12153.1 D-alanyl-D-alanine carboxypeptidase family protein [Macrococcus lamae]
MKKLLISAISVMVLTGCSAADDSTVSESSVKSLNTALKTKPLKKIFTHEHEKEVKDGVTYIDGILIVNKTIALPADYAPGENKVARQAVEWLIADGDKEGMQFVIRSGYRTYDYQQNLYREYVARDGEQAADKYSAKPGHSEHQTGLTYDIGSVASANDFRISFGDTPEGAWLKNHAHEYGFIIRYPEGKEHITGYQYEPWHVRYVGKRLASEFYKNNKTLEEYLGLYK